MTSDWDLDLIRRHGGSGPRYTSYPPALKFHEEIDRRDYEAAIWQGNLERRPLSLYFHIPFCNSVCYYCACNRIITNDKSRATDYLERLIQEMRLRSALPDSQRPVVQMHWGGGTPTFLSDAQMTALVYNTGRLFNLQDNGEADYSIEIDPRTVDRSRIALLRGLGFNRVSLGIQDLDPKVQRAVNRVQPYEQIREVFGWVRDFSFRSVNADLIYGLPWQSESSLARTVEQLAELRPERISLYNYAHMPARFKIQRNIPEAALPPPAEKLRMLARAGSLFEQAGYRLVGMDHFALPEDDLAIAQDNGTLHRNFQGYTLHGDADLIGMGVSAISQVGAYYGQNFKAVPTWQDVVDQRQLPIERGYLLNRDEQIRRAVIMQLLCLMSLDFETLGEQWQIDIRDYFASELKVMQQYEREGLVELSNEGLRVTAPGRLVARSLAAVFDRTLQHHGHTDQRYSRII